MKSNYKILLSAVISIILLILFMFFKYYDAKILSLENKWLIVSGIPLLIGLLYSGIIKEFDAFGIKVKTNLQEKIPNSLINETNYLPTPKITKQSLNILNSISREEKNKINVLQFIIGKKGYYETYAIKKYLEELTHISYFEFVDEDLNFKGVMKSYRYPLKLRHTRIENNQEEKRKLNEIFENKIKKLIKEIENGSILKHREIISNSISENNTILEGYEKFILNERKKDNCNEELPIINSNNKMIGLLKRYDLSDRISKQILKSK